MSVNAVFQNCQLAKNRWRGIRRGEPLLRGALKCCVPPFLSTREVFRSRPRNGQTWIGISYREISLWIRILNQSPIKTDYAQSVSSTCRPIADNKCCHMTHD